MSTSRRVLIIGAAGQDGTYLQNALSKKDVEICILTKKGLYTPSRGWRSIKLTDPKSFSEALRDTCPDQVFYLAAHHGASSSNVEHDESALPRFIEINTTPLLTLLETARRHLPKARIFYASSSRVFGHPADSPQTENTPIAPRTAYGISKALGMEACRIYRSSHDVFAASGILYNHESPLRTPDFFTKKVVMQISAAKQGQLKHIRVDNLDTYVDWGWAPDYVDAFWQILELDQPEDFVISSGTSHQVRDFLGYALNAAGLPKNFPVTSGSNESSIELPPVKLIGDHSKLTAATGWTARRSLKEIANLMVEAEIKK